MKFTMAFICVLLLTFSQQLVAGGFLSSNKIENVAFQTGGFFLYADDWGNPNNCTRATAVVLKDTDRNYDKAYSLLLAAFLSAKPVMGYSDGCVEFDGQTYNSVRGFKYLSVR
jgi:hypothetical protein